MDLGSELAVATSEPQPAFFVGVPEPPKWNMLCATYTSTNTTRIGRATVLNVRFNCNPRGDSLRRTAESSRGAANWHNGQNGATALDGAYHGRFAPLHGESRNPLRQSPMRASSTVATYGSPRKRSSASRP